jgi:hypothetical protein
MRSSPRSSSSPTRFPDDIRLDDWKDPYTSSVLAGEYMKFLAATVRVAVASSL